MHARDPALDGLRAAACVSVVAFHCGVPGFRAGWLGVDVFFVLSGYLITGLLPNEQREHGSVDLVRFYVRRTARLYPALIVCVGLTLALPDGATLDQARLALAYMSDVARALQLQLGMLGHTWSLAIEEHFYLTWPLILGLCHTRRALALVTVALGSASLAGFVWLAPPGAELGPFAYNFPGTRVWELLLGCLLAQFLAGRRPALPRRLVVALPWLSGALFALAAVHGALRRDLDSTGPLLAAPATALLLLALARPTGHTPRRTTTLLGAAAPAYLGRISYGLYLFHDPAVAYLRAHAVPALRAGHVPVLADLPTWLLLLPATLTIATGLAAMSYRYLETPVLGLAGRRFRSSTRSAAQPAGSRTATG